MPVSSLLHMEHPSLGAHCISEMEDEGGAEQPGQSEKQMSANALESVVESSVPW